MTRIAILETGHPPEHLKDDFDDYPARFRALLGEGVEVAGRPVRRADLSPLIDRKLLQTGDEPIDLLHPSLYILGHEALRESPDAGRHTPPVGGKLGGAQRPGSHAMGSGDTLCNPGRHLFDDGATSSAGSSACRDRACRARRCAR